MNKRQLQKCDYQSVDAATQDNKLLSCKQGAQPLTKS